MGVGKTADHRQNQQDMQKHLVGRQGLIQDADTAYHRNKVKELADKCRKDFPQHGQDIGKDFKPLYFVQRRRKQSL